MSRARWDERVDPELRPLLRMLPTVTFGPMSHRVFRLLEPLIPAPRRPRDLTTRTVRLGANRVHLFQPTGGLRHRAAVLWMHGGGRIVGRPQQGSAYPCMRIARSLGVLTVAVQYRLAPKHRFPAALDDCVAAYRWLQSEAAALGIDPDRIAVGGESAGGGLAAELSQRLRDEGGVQPAGQVLIYPMLDDRTATRDALTAQRHLVWNNQSNHYGWSQYLGQPAGAPSLPKYAAAARCDDLTALPPAWLTVGPIDLFYEENVEYIERLRAAGVSATLHMVEGGFHGYFAVGRHQPPIERMWDSLRCFLRTHLGIADESSPPR